TRNAKSARRASQDTIAPTLPRSQAVPLVVLLPGSRVAELKRHLPVMMAAARLIKAAKPDTLFKMTLPNEELKRLADGPFGPPPQLEIQVGALAESLAQAELAIASTGT